MMNRKGPKGHAGTLSLGKKKIEEKLQSLEEERDSLITSINSYVEKAHSAGKRLLEVEHRNTFFNKYQSVSQQLQRCIDSLYLLQTTLIEGSDAEDDDSDICENNEHCVTRRVQALQSSFCPSVSSKTDSALSVCSEDVRNVTSESIPISRAALSFPTNFCLSDAQMPSTAKETTPEEVQPETSAVPCFLPLKESSSYLELQLSSNHLQLPPENAIGGLSPGKTIYSSRSSFYSVPSQSVSGSEYSYCTEEPTINENFCVTETVKKKLSLVSLPKQEPNELASDESQIFLSSNAQNDQSADDVSAANEESPKDYLCAAALNSLQERISPESLRTLPKPCATSSEAGVSFHSTASLTATDNNEQYFSEDEFLPKDSQPEFEAKDSLQPEFEALTTETTVTTNVESLLRCEQTSSNAELIPCFEKKRETFKHSAEKLEISLPFVPVGSEVFVRIVKIDSPNDFYVFCCVAELENMLRQIANHLRVDSYKGQRKKGIFTENEGCVVLSPNKDSWMRAVITKIISADQVEVALVDLGGRMIVPVSNLHNLDRNTARFPASVIRCSLKGVESLGKTWSQMEVDKFVQITKNNLKATFHPSLEDGRYPVHLVVLHFAFTFPIDVTDYLITGGWAKDARNSNAPVSPVNGDVRSSSACSNDSTGPTNQRTKKQKNKACKQYQWNADIGPCLIIPNEKKQISCILSVIFSPGEFYINVVDEDSVVLDELREQMDTFYGSSKQVPEVASDRVHVGSCWCTRFTNDGFWYRVRVVDVMEIKKDGKMERLYKVRYVDYGNVEQVKVEDLRPLAVEFSQPSAYAARCSLALIKPAKGSAWEPQATAKFRELTGYEKVLTAEIEDSENDEELLVHLWDTVDSKDVHINMILVDEKLAVAVMCNGSNLNNIVSIQNKEEELCEETNLMPVAVPVRITYSELEDLARQQNSSNSNTIESSDELKNWDPMSSDYNSIRNSYELDVDDAGVAMVGYKAKDEQYICRHYSRYGQCRKGDFCMYQHIQPSKDGTTLDKVEETICSKVIPLPAKNTLVFVQVSAAIDPNHFYVVFPLGTAPATYIEDTYEEEDELNDMLQEICNHYSESTFSEDLTLAPAIGSMVAVHDQQDDHWYRGRVLVVDEENVMVFFVDSGHTETVPRRCVRRLLPQFLHVPDQAVECFMDLKPRYNKWSKEASVYFKKLTEGKLLLAEVRCVGRASIHVDLYSQTNHEVHIASALVANNFAVADGPKKKAEFPMQPKEEDIVRIPG